MTEKHTEPLPGILYPNIKSELYIYGMHRGVAGPGPVCARHLHHLMLELNLVLSGCQTAIAGQSSYSQNEGDLLIIPPMQMHHYLSEHREPLHYFVIHIQVSDSVFLQRMTQTQPLFLPKGHPLNEETAPLLEQLLKLLEGSASSIAVTAKAMSIIAVIEQYLVNEMQVHLSQTEENLAFAIAREIEKIVLPSDNENRAYVNNWLEQIAAKLSISRRHCHRVFQQTYRMSPRQYLAVLKQQEAMHLLVNSDDSLEQIAWRIGFENVQSFIRQFSKWSNMTPGSFRKQERNSLHYLTPLELV